MNIKWVGCHPNNFAKGRSGRTPKKIVLHWIVGTLESADATFANGTKKISAHYGIGDNEIHQYVKEEDTAWHSGDGDVNRESIGIEHEGGWELRDGSRMTPTEATIQTSAKLVADIAKRYNITIGSDTVIPHSSVAPTACPGSLDVAKVIKLAKEENMSYIGFDHTKKLSNELWKLFNLDEAKGLPRDTSVDSIAKEWNKKVEEIKKLDNEVGELGREIDLANDTMEAMSQDFAEKLYDLHEDLGTYKDSLEKIEPELERLQLLIQAMEIRHAEELAEMESSYKAKLDEKFEDKSASELFLMFLKSIQKLFTRPR